MSTQKINYQANIKLYNELKERGLILYEVVTGSQAYGTATPASDIDKKFVYMMPEDEVLKRMTGDDFPEQIFLSKDYTGWEISRFLDLLQVSNPSALEIVFQPDDTVEYCHPLFRQTVLFRRQEFLTKKTRFSFGKYASDQIKKARGGNKKMMKPMPKKRKGPLDFCYVAFENGSLPLKKFLKQHKGFGQEWYGLTRISHMENNYHIFEDPKVSEMILLAATAHHSRLFDANKSIKTLEKHFSNQRRPLFKGIVKNEDTSMGVSLSSIPKGLKSIGVMSYNAPAFSDYCKRHKEYWEWVEERNPERYKDNMLNGNGYDVKNMMHCVRLLETAIEIFTENTINVRRPNREFLLSIRHGKADFEEIMTIANDRIKKLDEVYKASTLPEVMSKKIIKEILLEVRKGMRYGNV